MIENTHATNRNFKSFLKEELEFFSPPKMASSLRGRHFGKWGLREWAVAGGVTVLDASAPVAVGVGVLIGGGLGWGFLLAFTATTNAWSNHREYAMFQRLFPEQEQNPADTV